MNFKSKIRICLVIWFSVFIVGLVGLNFAGKSHLLPDESRSINSDGSPKLQPSSQTIATVPNTAPTETQSPLLVFSAGNRSYRFGREEAIKFGLERVTKYFEYGFVAAAALLGFILKVCIEPLLKSDSNGLLDSKAMFRMWNGALACCCSIAFGGYGFGYFAAVPTAVSFSIYDEVGFSALLQFGVFLLACLLVLSVVPEIIVRYGIKVNKLHPTK